MANSPFDSVHRSRVEKHQRKVSRVASRRGDRKTTFRPPADVCVYYDCRSAAVTVSDVGSFCARHAPRRTVG